MSAWFCTKETIDAAVDGFRLAGYIMPAGELNYLGKLLWSMNAAALVQRYDYDPAEFEPDVKGYTYAPSGINDPIVIAKQVACLIYQCSEGDVPTWPLYKTLSEVGKTISPTGADKTDAWRNAPWGIEENA